MAIVDPVRDGAVCRVDAEHLGDGQSAVDGAVPQSTAAQNGIRIRVRCGRLVYIAGASLSVGLSVALFAEAGVLASTLLLTLGTAAFVLQRRTEPAPRRSEPASRRAAILLRPVQLITLAMVFVGTIFATAEVCIVALTREWGNPDAASLVIGVYAAGSFILGVIMGGLKLRAALHRQMLVAIGVLLITPFLCYWRTQFSF